MSRRNTALRPVPVDEAVAPSLWPDDFASPRNTILALFCVATWGGILAVLAVGNDLLGLKKALLLLAGARMEPVLGAASLHSVDIAVVIAGFVLIAGAGYVHVSLGLAAVLALRPWLDGFTYPTDNFYFLWAVLLLVAIWAVRQFRSPVPVRGGVPLALFSIFYACCLLSAVNSIQFDATFRELLHWAACGTTLFLAINATPHPTSRGVVLMGLFAGMAGQALFAFPHLWYVLPWLREYLQEDPRRLAQWFKGATEFTPELARRFNLNRAFASMVFPNALAALLILGIPASLACAWNGVASIRGSGSGCQRSLNQWRYIVPFGVTLFVGICVPLYLLGQLPLAYGLGATPWFGSARNLVYLSVLTSAIATTLFLLCARKFGLARAGQVLGAVGALMLTPLMCGALWITYSRGAMLALVAAGCICALLYVGRFRCWRGAAASLLVLVLTAAPILAPGSAGAEGSPTAPSTAVSGEGMDVTIGELADPGSMRLRLGYWRVACSIALEHSATGVGLGNFRIAYGPYQYLGAGDVQNAHNAVLQTWCEAGLPGVLAFLAFWGVFLWSGRRIILSEARPARRRLLLGLFGGVLAFLLHSLLDINFSHPSLVMYVLAAAGLFWSYAAPEAMPVRVRDRVVAAPLLLLAALAAGMALRPFLLDLSMNGGRFVNVSNRSMNESRHNAAIFFLVDGPAWAVQGKPDPPPTLPIGDAVALIADRGLLFEAGRILAPDPEGKRLVPLAPESALPAEAVFQMVRPWAARNHAIAGVDAWIAELERLDRRFPHDHQTAYLIGGLYKRLVEQSGPESADHRERWLAAMLNWSEEAVRRSPMHKDMYQMLAWAEWCCGTKTSGAVSLDHFQKALRNFRRSTELGHLEPNYYFAESEALAALGKAYQNAGKAAEGATYLQRSTALRSDGERLQKARWDLGLQ
ncbi:MAG: O-antigen ligase family protein [Candidatus Hydrogenedentes bacterium]|nr:O-antigen ligase family protein [Candidatus Hydrogenedentota bacterium]